MRTKDLLLKLMKWSKVYWIININLVNQEPFNHILTEERKKEKKSIILPNVSKRPLFVIQVYEKVDSWGVHILLIWGICNDVFSACLDKFGSFLNLHRYK